MLRNASARWIQTMPANPMLGRRRAARIRAPVLAARLRAYETRVRGLPLLGSGFMPWLRAVAESPEGGEAGISSRLQLYYGGKALCTEPFRGTLVSLAGPLLEHSEPGVQSSAPVAFPTASVVAEAVHAAVQDSQQLFLVQRILREYERRMSSAGALEPGESDAPGSGSLATTMPAQLAGMLVARAIQLRVHPRHLCSPLPAGGLVMDPHVAAAALDGPAPAVSLAAYVRGYPSMADARLWCIVSSAHWVVAQAALYCEKHGAAGLSAMEHALQAFLQTCARADRAMVVPGSQQSITDWLRHVIDGAPSQ